MTRRYLSFIAPFAVLLALAIVAPGCSDDSAPRSTVTIETINQSQVLDSDVYNNGEDKLPNTEDDYIIEDQVPVLIRNRPHDAGLNIRANGPFSSVVFERYEIRFTGDETLAPLFGAIHLRVASGATGTGIVTIVPAGYKEMPPLIVLRGGGEMRFSAEVTLIGREEDSDDEVRATAVIPVHCANWTDPDN
jgi:hypothetical protein